jgi:hypothetical protein
MKHKTRQTGIADTAPGPKKAEVKDSTNYKK